MVRLPRARALRRSAKLWSAVWRFYRHQFMPPHCCLIVFAAIRTVHMQREGSIVEMLCWRTKCLSRAAG